MWAYIPRPHPPMQHPHVDRFTDLTTPQMPIDLWVTRQYIRDPEGECDSPLPYIPTQQQTRQYYNRTGLPWLVNRTWPIAN